MTAARVSGFGSFDTIRTTRRTCLQNLTISASSLDERLREGQPIVTLDVREDFELQLGHIPGAIHLALSELEPRARAVLPSEQARIVVYCARGVRSAKAAKLLQRLGYHQVSQLEGGFFRWKSLGLPIEPPAAASQVTSNSERYSRQLLLTEVGSTGQQKLAQARVLLIGVGGLGSPAALYLAGAGIGTLGLVDADVVELSNLHRQIMHDTSRIDTKKVDSAKARIEAANPNVELELYAERFCPESADRILERGWDAVIDGADNFPTRYTLNDVASRRGIPVCHGSIDRFEGRVTTFLGNRGPCYRCLFPQPPLPGTVGSCAERGVLGVLPGVIGTLQATEALKLVLGIGQPLSGRLLTYDALELRFAEMRYGSDPDCPSCQARVDRS